MPQAAAQRWFSRALSALLLLAPASLFAAGPNDLASYDALIKPEQRKHWAFQPVRKPALPAIKNAAWAQNPIDAFILAKLEAKGWSPAPPVDARAFLRRIHADVIGLPPTPQEQERFVKDGSPQAVEKLIDDLLARPSYGERWGRHWLDLVRYADTNGYERDGAKPNVWRYRDYVIHSFNADKPFDRFILEQLTGDELPDADTDTLIASGFSRLGPWDDEPADVNEDRFDQLDDMVSTTSLVFLGLTLGCARCHNHKFEPLTMHDYYRMVAVFDPLKRPQFGRQELDLPATSRQRLAVAASWEAAERLAGIGYPLVGAGSLARPWLTSLAAWQLARRRGPLADLPHGYFLRESSTEVPATHLLIRGKAARPGPVVQAGVPTVLVSRQPAFLTPDQRTTRRRLSLARWLASPDNPLTARVLVNRVWQFHFGEGLVRTPSDFGVMGDPPTHPELLDWLTDYLVKEGWSIKKLHRLILTSSTYRMSKKWNAAYGAKDPEDRLLWRFPYRRLEVEVLRDSMLAASSRLNLKMYGPSMYPQVPKEALEGNSDPDKVWQPFEEKEASRRTIYAFLKRSLIVPMLEVLDLCDTNRSSARRAVTTVAPQALSLFNGAFVNQQAHHLAARLVREAGDDPARQIERAYLLVLCRPPTASEGEAAEQFLKRESLQQFCRVLFNLNEFAYVD
jgi:Protein of unknown function (DUF1553)/Protein of unknown function (DUF1549)